MNRYKNRCDDVGTEDVWKLFGVTLICIVSVMIIEADFEACLRFIKGPGARAKF